MMDLGCTISIFQPLKHNLQPYCVNWEIGSHVTDVSIKKKESVIAAQIRDLTLLEKESASSL